VAVPLEDSGGPISVNVACGGGFAGEECPRGFDDPAGFAAVIYLYAADLELEQSAGPELLYVGGDLDGAQVISGTTDVVISATDPGSGMYEAIFTVDGQVVQQSLLDENGGECRSVGTDGGVLAFLYVQPCAHSVSVDLPFDTRQLSNGAHTVVVTVTDPAGNTAEVLKREVTVSNSGAPLDSGGGSTAPGPPNGSNASSQATLTVAWAHSSHARLLVNYGHAETAIGRLTAPGGAPIVGAQIEVHATPETVGAGTAAMSSPVTDSNGRFELRVPAGVSSRALHFAYRASLGASLPVATRTLTLGVRAAVALAVSPHTTSVGHSIFFHGQLRGGAVPRDGKQLVLEARSPGGRWIEFDVVRSNSHGRFTAGYRFKFPGPAEYQFRAVSEPESDYPFVEGASHVVDVHER